MKGWTEKQTNGWQSWEWMDEKFRAVIDMHTHPILEVLADLNRKQAEHFDINLIYNWQQYFIDVLIQTYPYIHFSEISIRRLNVGFS